MVTLAYQIILSNVVSRGPGEWLFVDYSDSALQKSAGVSGKRPIFCVFQDTHQKEHLDLDSGLKWHDIE